MAVFSAAHHSTARAVVPDIGEKKSAGIAWTSTIHVPTPTLARHICCSSGQSSCKRAEDACTIAYSTLGSVMVRGDKTKLAVMAKPPARPSLLLDATTLTSMVAFNEARLIGSPPLQSPISLRSTPAVENTGTFPFRLDVLATACLFGTAFVCAWCMSGACQGRVRMFNCERKHTSPSNMSQHKKEH